MKRIILPGGVEMSVQPIPAGEFRMGSRGYDDDEEPVHRVRITKAYYLGTYPVTQEQFAVFRPEHENRFADRPIHPAESMTWHDAVAFCEWLTESCADSMPHDHMAVLPSEAQWEYACRARIETEYHSGDGESALAEVGWYDGNSEDSTQSVGLLWANAYGLYDMHGNVDEWCRDAWDADAYKRRVDGVCDPFTDSGDDDAVRVVRGGSWFREPRYCRAASRYWWRPSFRFRNLGFRVCLVSGPCPGSRRAEP